MPDIIDHDSWNHALPRQPQVPKINLESIYEDLAIRRCVQSQLPQRNLSQDTLYLSDGSQQLETQSLDSRERGKLAASHEALISETTYDLQLQPRSVKYKDKDGRNRTYTHDLPVTIMSGHRRLVLVRNRHSLLKSQTRRENEAIITATPKQAANDLIVVNADNYARQRRENLFRTHAFIFSLYHEIDEMTSRVAHRLKFLYYMRDLSPRASIAPTGCLRLVIGSLVSDFCM